MSIFRERRSAVDTVNLILFGGLLVIFILLLVCSIALEAIGKSEFALMAVDLSDIGLLLTASFYFEWVLCRN